MSVAVAVDLSQTFAIVRYCPLQIAVGPVKSWTRMAFSYPIRTLPRGGRNREALVQMGQAAEKRAGLSLHLEDGCGPREAAATRPGRSVDLFGTAAASGRELPKERRLRPPGFAPPAPAKFRSTSTVRPCQEAWTFDSAHEQCTFGDLPSNAKSKNPSSVPLR